MNRRALFLLALLLPLSACTLSLGDGDGDGDGDGYGYPYPAPPPYGRWHWDDDLDVYVSIGYPRLYYRDRIYYRWDDHGWYWGNHHGGPWQPQGHRSMPPGLYREHPHSGSPGGQGGSGRQDHDSGQEQWRAPRGQQDQQKYQGQQRQQGQQNYQGQQPQHGQYKQSGQQGQHGQPHYQPQSAGSKGGPPSSAQGGQGKQVHGQQSGKGQNQGQGQGQGQGGQSQGQRKPQY